MNRTATIGTEPSAMLEELLARRTTANLRFFEAEADRLARLCHLMAERFARGGLSLIHI